MASLVEFGPADTIFEPGVPALVPPPAQAQTLNDSGPPGTQVDQTFSEPGVPSFVTPDFESIPGGSVTTFVGPLYQPVMRGGPGVSPSGGGGSSPFG